MALADMIHADEDALFCDFAETYQIIGFRGLPATIAATLAVGLRASSRIKAKIGGVKEEPPGVIIDAFKIDLLQKLCYLLSGDKKAIPKSLTDIVMNGIPEEEEKTRGFKSGKEFDAAYKNILLRIKGEKDGD